MNTNSDLGHCLSPTKKSTSHPMEFLRSAIFLIGLFCFMGFAVDEGLGLKCYQCTSENNSSCSDPFDKTMTELVDCADVEIEAEEGKGLNHTMCRKTIQKILDHERTIRECGWAGDLQDQLKKGCYLRAGTFEIQILYCTCAEDGCNKADAISSPAAAILLLAAIFFSSTILY